MSPDTILEFYDIPSKLPGIAWSPNTWKTRYCLNYKGIPYKTIWVEYPDIASTCKRIGAAPTTTKSDGTPLYTLPVIRDPSTGIAISDSPRIADYLEKTYPDTPRLFPPGTRALQAAFYDEFEDNHLKMASFVIPKVALILNPRSFEFFKEDRSKRFGSIAMEDLYPKGEKKVELWKRWKDTWGVVASWMEDTDTFIMGNDTITFADFVVAGWVIWPRHLWGEDSEEWKDIASWHGGRWGRLIERLSEYETIV
ncbi:hypothetical protein E1B28_012057 [Marasmius oreades]|uniref:GST N-terminal domain-containing protein n=1 Tax=Marasmius oreades TaxID=181124 RepID=A0A9P7RQV7_9AGAR|nr:uncharacterized protein E1B28_012057 [Marasmius oreades]KAG7088020.1 hypothetical protein E1B28_012057 [Marasmius oreades]